MENSGESGNGSATEGKTQGKKFSVDGFVSGVGKICSIGEIPDDPVVKVLKRIASWLKYLLVIEAIGGLLAFVPYYSFKLIKEGRTDDLAEFMVKVADVARSEETESPPDVTYTNPAERQCPDCGSCDIEIWDTTQDMCVWKCRQCGKEFKTE